MKKKEEALLKYMGENDIKILKTEFPDKLEDLTKTLAYPYEYFNSIDDYQKPGNDLKKEDFFSKLRNKCPSDKKKNEQRNLLKDSILKMVKNL